MNKIRQKDISKYLNNLSVSTKTKQTKEYIITKFKGIVFEFEEINKKFDKSFKDTNESTKNIYKLHLNHFIKYLNIEYNLNISMLKQTLISSINDSNKMTYDEFIVLINSPNKYADEMYIQYMLGLRVSEMKLITWEDILLNDSMKIKSKNKIRTLYFSNHTKYLANGKSGILLKVHANNYNNYLKKISRTLLDKEVTSHAIRHLRTNQLRKAGIDYKVIQDLMGHSSIVTTQRYFKSDDEEIEKAINIL